MKCVKITVPWREGLHLRRAAQLVKVARQFRSTVCLKYGGRMADLRSVVSMLALCATLGALLDLEATGEDEQEAAQTLAQVFVPDDFTSR